MEPHTQTSSDTYVYTHAHKHTHTHVCEREGACVCICMCLNLRHDDVIRFDYDTVDVVFSSPPLSPSGDMLNRIQRFLNNNPDSKYIDRKRAE